MALSNYDSIAFGPDGNFCNGEFSYKNWRLELYKNWVYVYQPNNPKSEEVRIKGNRFVGNCIGKINEGSATFGPYDVVIKRGKTQGSVFVYASVFDFKKNDSNQTNYLHFAGVACYGFKTIEDYIKEFNLKIKLTKRNDYFWGYTSSWDGKIPVEAIENFQTREKFVLARGKRACDKLRINSWIGIKPETYNEFLTWLQKTTKGDKESKTWFDKVSKLEPASTNQGDAFFGKHLGYEPQKIKIGKKHTPVLEKLIHINK